MSLKVVFLHSAELDLKELRGYIIKHFGEDTWQDSYSKIKASIVVIQTYPLGGHIPEEFESLNLTQYRQVMSGMNRIIYEVRQDTVYIHLVCDSRKDMKSLLMRRILREV
ncbi:type II toxin-antitoxin system RelE/ParE family toxin [Sulfuriferula nivalis]|uniref:Plasmid stabilization protein n=1 Tax=Sulfuriferula nivalis TaxID=2675298 RepID=A0A809RDG2_9PROT|nr:plasmid stabilization protein [Sulfuriferula nivalis]